MNKNFLETLLGGVVVIIAVFFMIFAYNKSDIAKKDGYIIHAKFNRADGIGIGSEVRIAGIKIGSVISEKLDTENFDAILTLNISHDIKLSDDSSAQILSDGLMGQKFVNLSPGNMDNLIKENGYIKYTQSSVNLETLIGKMVFSGHDDDKK